MNRINELSKEQKNQEKILIAKVLDKVRFASEKNKFQYISFLDLSQQMTVNKTLEMRKINNCQLFGGYEHAERKMLIIFPEKHLENIVDIEKYKKSIYNEVMKILRLTLPKELNNNYEHRTYLGALMKMGLKREKIGDIIVRKDGADVLISTEIESYLVRNIQGLTRFQKSKIDILPIDELKYIENKKEIIKINVPSMRLDCIVSELAKCSRNEASRLIAQERVFVNFKEELVSSKKTEEGDFITIRGKGRFRVLKISGTTRRGRLTVEIEK